MKQKNDEQPLSSDAAENASLENGTDNASDNLSSGLPNADIENEDALAGLEAELSEQKDKFLRLYSEFENYKKRSQRERLDYLKFAGEDVMKAFLPVFDDLDRALKAMSTAQDVEAVKEGVVLIQNKLNSIADSKGLKPMNAVGTLFDAELHDALTQVPAPSEDLKGKVLEEVEKGFYFNDKVIRHAKVIVGS